MKQFKHLFFSLNYLQWPQLVGIWDKELPNHCAQLQGRYSGENAVWWGRENPHKYIQAPTTDSAKYWKPNAAVQRTHKSVESEKGSQGRGWARCLKELEPGGDHWRGLKWIQYFSIAYNFSNLKGTKFRKHRKVQNIKKKSPIIPIPTHFIYIISVEMIIVYFSIVFQSFSKYTFPSNTIFHRF